MNPEQKSHHGVAAHNLSINKRIFVFMLISGPSPDDHQRHPRPPPWRKNTASVRQATAAAEHPRELVAELDKSVARFRV
ncbi:MAG: hypothetical protein ACYCWC_01420 [Rhodocyclaceae bacterium]